MKVQEFSSTVSVVIFKYIGLYGLTYLLMFVELNSAHVGTYFLVKLS